MPYSRASVRTLRSGVYLLLAVAGVLLFGVLDGLPGIIPPLWQVMASWLVLGGLLGISGQLRRRWTGEFVGLPLLFSALFGFGVLQGNLLDWALEAVPSVAILWAFSLSLGGRWMDVWALYRASRREVR
jgi:hypothetical protein